MKTRLSILALVLASGTLFACPECDQKAAEEYRKDVAALMPEFSAFGARKDNRYELLGKDKKVIGYMLVAPDKKYERTEGFNAYINTAAVLNKDGKVAGVVIGKHEETPRFMDKVRNAGFMKKWNGKTVKEAKELKVDAVSGATYSCEAIKAELKTIFGNSSIK